MQRFLVSLVIFAAFAALLPFARANADETANDFSPVEGRLPAAQVRAGVTALDWTADADRTLSGFYVRLTNCVPPREEPVVVALRVDGKLAEERVEIPAFTFPLVLTTRPHTLSAGVFPPFDVAREFRQALVTPIAVRKGQNVRLEIVSSEKLTSGVTVGLQFEGRYRLASFRNPFRDCRTNGPVCRIPWSNSEVLAVGTQKKFDPLCAPQNNSSIIDDADGTLYQFTAYYSVDEQYGGGRGGSYSRIFGYKKAVGADAWEPLGLVVDLRDNWTYAGDPFVLRDLDGTPTLVFSVCDGTNGFENWGLGSTYFIRSKTKSFAGPWGEPVALWKNYPRDPDDNKTGGRANCLRIFPRKKTNDYLVAWNHGAQDMDIRAVVVPTLDAEISHEQINNAQIFVKNQEEGGGGFTIGDKGYYSTWQIPWLNDPNGVQRLYEIDLNDPLNPESWRVVPGSIGFNDGTSAFQDGGCTADAWAISLAGGELWASACEFSHTDHLNRLNARHVPLDPENLFPKSDVFQYGSVYSGIYFETFPAIEYAVGEHCSLEFDFRSLGKKSYGFIAVGSNDQPMFAGSVYFEFNPDGVSISSRNAKNEQTVLAKEATPTWKPNETNRLKLVRDGARFVAFVNGKEVVSATVDDAETLKYLANSPRFKLYGWQGGRYEISNAVLVDGK